MSSSSAARLSDTASDDPLDGIEPANDAYGSLASLATRPKPKKKPVLVLDADELAAAHELFQLGAAEQLEDADQMERRPVMLGLAPLGSDMEVDDTPDADEEEYAVEADAPAPDDVLGLTRAEAPEEPATPRNPKKSMVALPPDGDPELDSIEPFVPLAPIDPDAADEDYSDSEVPVEDGLPTDELPDEQPVEEPEEAEPSSEDVITHSVEDVPSPLADPEATTPQDEAPRITRVEEEEVDGSAFMRGPERHKIDIANSVGPTSQNSLRARLVRETEPEPEPEPEGIWARFTAWLSGVWNRFLG